MILLWIEERKGYGNNAAAADVDAELDRENSDWRSFLRSFGTTRAAD